jgi:hypothetical protein
MGQVPITLLLQNVDGSATEEYRVIGGEIQIRELSPNRLDKNSKWRILNSEELIAHVEKNTIVSQWLRQRLGWRGLLRACVADQRGLYGDAAEKNPRVA